MQKNYLPPTLNKPIISTIQKGNSFKVLLIELNKGSKLEKHKTSDRAKIFVISGVVKYQSLRGIITIPAFKLFNIPLNEFHEVVALKPSKFLLIIG